MQRRAHRLHPSLYIGAILAYTTICCDQMKPHFLNRQFALKTLRELHKSSVRFHTDVLAYVIMPNHIHLLTRGTRADSDFIRFITLFKQSTGYTWKQHTRERLWQRSYYDHLLREEKDMYGIISYILQNPVRAGLVDDYKKYPYVGSFIWTLDELAKLMGY